MREACSRFGYPERHFAIAHVAGTNGKGSTCAMLEAIARAEGLRTGLYTSPHLCRFAERIRLDGAPIADDALAEVLTRALDDPAELSFFEVATLAAFLAFHAAAVDIAIVEVGLGGRLDATNVVPTPRAAAITRIALDHTDFLGDSLVDIAREKAGIAKPGLDIVLGPMPPDVRAAIDAVAQSVGATTTSAFERDDATASSTVGLSGSHQIDNARVASMLGARIGASDRAIREGVAHVHWPGRNERIGRYLLDAAHNPDGAASLVRYVRSLGPAPERTSLLFGALADKDWRPMLALLAPLASDRIYLAPQSAARPVADPRSMRDIAGGVVGGTIADALNAASGDLVVVTGSILLVGDARATLLGLPRDPPVAL